jgi:hypothetical protein
LRQVPDVSVAPGMSFSLFFSVPYLSSRLH